MRQLNIPQTLLGLSLAVIIGILLGSFYALIAQSLTEGWLHILILHSFLGLLGLQFLPKTLRPLPQGSQLKSLRAAGLVIFGSLGLCLVSRPFGTSLLASPPAFEPKTLALIFWVPWAEELVFRGGFGRLFEHYLGQWWGNYGSSLLFSLAHGAGAFSSFGLPVLPIGPFLLGVFCSQIYRQSGRLSGPIALHAACNATPLIFTWLDPRWLVWLQNLYLTV